jgi:hypothetical protein
MQFFKRMIFLILFSISSLKADPEPEPVIFNNLTILVSSCDKYSEVWPPFFKFLFKQWPSLKTHNAHVPIVLISNKEVYSDPRVTTICVGEEKAWGKNLLDVLPQIKTDYVLLLLEDYFIWQPVNEIRLLEIFEGMQKEKAVYIQISANDSRFNNAQHPPTSIPGVYVKPKFSLYRPSLQAALWNKKTLEWLTNPVENAWQFEVKGNERSQGMREPFLSVVENSPMVYLNAIAQGVWSQSVIDAVQAKGIEINARQLPADSQYPIYFWYTRTFKPAWKASWDKLKGALGLAKKKQ